MNLTVEQLVHTVPPFHAALIRGLPGCVFACVAENKFAAKVRSSENAAGPALLAWNHGLGSKLQDWHAVVTSFGNQPQTIDLGVLCSSLAARPRKHHPCSHRRTQARRCNMLSPRL